MFGFSIGMVLALVIIAFFAEYMDSTLGMGYGTALTPILILIGFEPLQVVPAVLLSEFTTGMLAGFTHHAAGNVDFRPKTMNIKKIIKSLREFGFAESFRRGIPLHLKIVLLIASCSIIGTLAAVSIAVSLPKLYLKLYIGILVFMIGITILVTARMEYGFSWKKITFLGLFASFNKGISGGGYGPVVTGGQLLAGVEGKNAIGITSLAEGLTCFIGVMAYLVAKNSIEWRLAIFLITGAIFSVPLSVYTVKKMKTRVLRSFMGIAAVILGLITLVKVLS